MGATIGKAQGVEPSIAEQMGQTQAGDITEQGLFFGKKGTAASPQETRHIVMMADMGGYDCIPRALILLANGVTIHKKYVLQFNTATKKPPNYRTKTADVRI
jgi:hypothetical protein